MEVTRIFTQVSTATDLGGPVERRAVTSIFLEAVRDALFGDAELEVECPVCAAPLKRSKHGPIGRRVRGRRVHRYCVDCGGVPMCVREFSKRDLQVSRLAKDFFLLDPPDAGLLWMCDQLGFDLGHVRNVVRLLILFKVKHGTRACKKLMNLEDVGDTSRAGSILRKLRMAS